MKRVLIIAGTYYPDSMATIGITQRLAEALVQNGCFTIVYSARYNGHKNPGYPKFHNGVEICQTDDYTASLSKAASIKKRFVSLRHKLFKRMSPHVENTDSIFSREQERFKYQQVQFTAELEADKIEQIIVEKNIDTLISVALPFGIHYYAHMVKKNNPQIRWIPISFDPYAFDEVTNASRKEACIAEEKQVLKYADRIMFLTQFQNDYCDSTLRDKICYFELPNIRRPHYDPEAGNIAYEQEKINCVFLGNLYRIQRHPQFLFDLFYQMNNPKIHLYIVGALVDLSQEYIDEWVEKFGGRLHYTGRVGQSTAINAMLDADILINIGHTTTNQCPSKVLDYMSTGRPILSISKIDNCTSLPYLSKYPRVVTLYEKHGITPDVVKEAENFILNHAKTEPLAFSEIEKRFKNATMEHLIELLEQ